MFVLPSFLRGLLVTRVTYIQTRVFFLDYKERKREQQKKRRHANGWKKRMAAQVVDSKTLTELWKKDPQGTCSHLHKCLVDAFQATVDSFSTMIRVAIRPDVGKEKKNSRSSSSSTVRSSVPAKSGPTWSLDKELQGTTLAITSCTRCLGRSGGKGVDEWLRGCGQQVQHGSR